MLRHRVDVYKNTANFLEFDSKYKPKHGSYWPYHKDVGEKDIPDDVNVLYGFQDCNIAGSYLRVFYIYNDKVYRVITDWESISPMFKSTELKKFMYQFDRI